MFKKILIANRGEIACRVMKTAKRMGIKTVAVYSEADRDAEHVKQADEAVLIGPAASAESYLVIDNIIQATVDSGADAVHPGYGFLSENHLFASKLKDEGVAFIGPDPYAMTSMGDKIESKKLAMKAGVNTVPGHAEAISGTDEAVKIANDIGYPVMLKASAGGGGKGMRIAWNDAECNDGFIRSTNEAKSSFGDDRVFIEKYIEEPRHIEIQVLADRHGTVLYLGERECSIQRRHQKVIEEAPSPFIDAKTRKSMGEQAVELAAAVDYVSAGTVEFIVDKNKNFYFLEMNTRLQVEHPVTEKITGLDLVEQMIRIANGEQLSITQEDVKITGWAMEARIYAEDPFRNFLPSIGRLIRYSEPGETNNVRVDSGVTEGGEISIFYDPMISKLITYGDTRDQAIEYMQSALDEYYIRGVNHNIAFLSALFAHKRFIEGNITTNFIAEEYPDGFHGQDLPPEDINIQISVAASIHMLYQQRAALISGQTIGHSRLVSNLWTVVIDDLNHPVHVIANDVGFTVTINDKKFDVQTQWKFIDPIFHGNINGQSVAIQVERQAVSYRLSHAGSVTDVMVLNAKAAELNALMLEKIAPDTSNLLLSPMPGLLVSVAVNEGQEVKTGEELAVVEAMKMENVLRAEKDAVIKSIQVEPGQSLMVDQIILDFE